MTWELFLEMVLAGVAIGALRGDLRRLRRELKATRELLGADKAGRAPTEPGEDGAA